MGPLPPQRHAFNKVQPPNGRSFMHITGIAQDKLGYMWFSSKHGLFRYNGYEMVNYKNDPVDPNSLPSDALEAICVDSAGNIWLGSLGAGLFKFDPVYQRFTRFRHVNEEPNSLASDWITSLLSDKDGNIWIGTSDGLDRYDITKGSFIHHKSVQSDATTLTSNEVVGLYQDRRGTIWVGTGSVYGINRTDPSLGGLNRMDNISGKFTRFKSNLRDTTTLISNKVRAMYETRDGTFWVGTAGDGLHIMDRATGKFRRLTFNPAKPDALSRPQLTGDPFAMISFITENASGGILIGTTDNGATYYDPTTKKARHIVTVAESEPVQNGGDNPWAAMSSSEGVVWVSTIGGSLYTYNAVEVKIPYHYLDEAEICGFYEDKDKSLWISSESGLLHLDKNKQLINKYVGDPDKPGALGTSQLLTLTPDKKGDLWIGTVGKGVEHFSTSTGKARPLSTSRNYQNTIGNDTVIRVYEDRSGNIWAGTFHGLSISDRKGENVRRYVIYPNDTTMYGRNLVSAIYQDKSDRCWVGTFVGGGLHLFNQTNGSFKTYLQGISILKVLEDTDGKLWVGGVEGLFYYDNRIDSFLRFNDPTGLTQIADVRSIVEDDQKNLWLASSSALRIVSADRSQVTTYDSHVGIQMEPNYGLAYKGNSGKLYFPASGGFYEFYPSTFNANTARPQIILSNFRISNQTILPGQNSVLKKDIAVTDKIVLAYNQNIFSFDFAAIDYVDPIANKHLFMLENYDRTWNVPGSDRRAVYFNVPPGRYVFRVRAVNAYGKWAERAVTVEIIPAWWSRWWFKVAVMIAVIALIYFLIRWRLNEKFRLQMERSEKEKELSRLQHRTSQLEMHALRAQMNPHFLFNSLNSINRFIIQNNSEQASGYLTKFSRLMRLILQNSQHELIPLENELEALRLYLELEAVRFDHHFTYAIKVDEHLDAGALKVPPLIIQPYAENAIWHGLMHKEEKGKLLIELKEEGDYLVCSITDDGIGRKKAAELKSKSASTHKSMGMKITADRIASMKQKKTSGNNIQITDLVLPDGSPGGTRVEIKISLHYD